MFGNFPVETKFRWKEPIPAEYKANRTGSKTNCYNMYRNVFSFNATHFIDIDWFLMKPWQKPLIALIALDDDVRLGILPHSNKFVDGDCSNTLSAAIEFKFQRGEILLMHPALVHYGCAYKKEDSSLRAHLYVF